jgi:hypothetical protein
MGTFDCMCVGLGEGCIEDNGMGALNGVVGSLEGVSVGKREGCIEGTGVGTLDGVGDGLIVG